MCSATTQLAEYFNTHPNITTDAGAVLFGDTVTITADGPWQHVLYKLTGRKWGNLDVENETGCGIVPYTYRPSIWSTRCSGRPDWNCCCLIKNPWQVFLSTDHPNGGCFWRYPEIIELLMCADVRKEGHSETVRQGQRQDHAAGDRSRIHAVRSRDLDVGRPGHGRSG